MAKHPKNRRIGRYIRGGIDQVLPLATLAPRTVLAVAPAGVVTERALVSSEVCSYTLSGWTPLLDAGPIVFGVAHSDYSAAEIEQWLEDAGTWTEGNKIAREVGARFIRQIGVFRNPDTTDDSTRFNDGRMKKTKLNWLLSSGQTLTLWVYNSGSVAVSAATGAEVIRTGYANLFPK